MESEPVKISLSRYFMLVICLACHLAQQQVWGVEVERINRVEVLVDGTDARTRARAMSGALAELLVRLSGSDAILSDPGAKELIRGAERYLLQYRYEEGGELADPGTTKKLVLEFDSVAVSDQLLNLGLPIWGLNRPGILVWWVEEHADGRRLLSRGMSNQDQDELPSDSGAAVKISSSLGHASKDYPLMRLLEDNGARRALPLVFPILDAEDRDQVTAADVWGSFSEPVIMASQRYTNDVILIAKTQRLGSSLFRVSWTLNVGGVESWNQVKGESLSDLVSKVVDNTAETLASQYAIARNQQGQSILGAVVVGVDRLTNYADLMAYLKSLVPVESLRPLAIVDDTVSFEIGLLGDLGQFERTLKLDGKLEEIVGEPVLNFGLREEPEPVLNQPINAESVLVQLPQDRNSHLGLAIGTPLKKYVWVK